MPQGDRVFVEYCADAGNRPHAQRLFDRWLGIALQSFGRPGSRGGRRAVELGLRGRSSHELIEEFLQDIQPYRTECQLAGPNRAALGLDGTDTAQAKSTTA